MNRNHQNISVYNRNASGFMKKFAHSGVRIRDIDLIFSYLSSKDPKIIEIGCGNGRDAAEFISRTKNYLGIDYSEGMISLAKKTNPHGLFKVGDFIEYKLPKGCDAIVAFAALVHSTRSETKKVINKAFASLKEGGIFFISLKYGKYGKYKKTDEFGTRIYYWYEPGDIKKMADGMFKVAYEHQGELCGERWFEVILQK